MSDPSVANVRMSLTSASSRIFRSIGTATRFSIRSGAIPGNDADTTAVRMTTTGSSRLGKLGYSAMPKASRPTMIVMVNRERSRPNRVRKFTAAYSCSGKKLHLLAIDQVRDAG